MRIGPRLRSARLVRCVSLAAIAIMVAVDAGDVAKLRAAQAETTPREPILLNADWRFHLGDPAGADSARLLYDVRPELRARSERAAEFTEEAERLGPASHPVLKPYILPTGNRFLEDPAGRSIRPAGDPGSDLAYVRSDFDDSLWRHVNLPHDWAIDGPFTSSGGGGMGRLPSAGIAWCRRKLDIPAFDAGKSIFLDVDGAMSYAAVWLNGKLVGGWPCGYASWRVDLTPYLAPGGKNQLAIRLDNPPDSSRWYSGAGIYRNVWLVDTSRLRG